VEAAGRSRSLWFLKSILNQAFAPGRSPSLNWSSRRRPCSIRSPLFILRLSASTINLRRGYFAYNDSHALLAFRGTEADCCHGESPDSTELYCSSPAPSQRWR
jgi:hypothetical protein